MGLGIVALAACAPRDAVRTELRFWLMGREAEVIAQLLPEFEQRNPGVRVKVQQLPWTAAHEKLLTAFAGDTLPDVSQLGNTWVPELAALGALEPLDARVAASSIVAQSDYFAGIWDTNRIDGVLRGIRGTWTRACSSTAATFWRKPASPIRRAPGKNGRAPWPR